MSQNRFLLILLAILVFSLGVRLISIQHGLPELQVGDENSDLSSALRLTEGELPGNTVRYHRTLIAYVDGAAIGGLFIVSMITGTVSGVSDFRDYYFSDTGLFTFSVRLLVALLTVAAIGFTALAGRAISKRVGLFAALVLALNGFFLINSSFALPDGLVMVAMALLMWLTMRVWQRRRGIDYFLAGMGMALVMLTKFPAVSAGIGLAVAHTAITWESSGGSFKTAAQRLILNRNIAWMVLGCVVGNVLFNPLPFLYPNDLIHEFRYRETYAYGATWSLKDTIHIIRDHIQGMILSVWRWMLPASILGLAAGVRLRRSAPYWIVLSAFLILFVTIANITTIFYKIFFWTPWLIPMALLSAIGLEELIVRWPARFWLGKRGAAVPIAVLFALEALFLFNVLSPLSRQDTRQQAADYIAAHFPADTRIMMGSPIAYSAPLQRSAASIERARSLGGESLKSWDWWLKLPADQRPGPAYDIYGPEMQSVIASYADMEQVIAQEDIAYVIEVEHCWAGTRSPESDIDFDFPAVSDTMRAEWELVKVFSPFGRDTCVGRIDDRTGLVDGDRMDEQERIGPIVRIYRVPAPG